MSAEFAFHKQIADALRQEIGPAGRISSHGALWFSVDMSNSAAARPGIRISRGFIAGIPDIFVLHRGRAFLIELKAKKGVLSTAQQDVIAHATLAGVKVAVVDSLGQVLAALDAWAVPRFRRIILPLDELN